MAITRSGAYGIAGFLLLVAVAHQKGWANPETSPNYYSWDPAVVEAEIAAKEEAEKQAELEARARAVGTVLVADTQFTHQVMPGARAPLDVAYDCTGDPESNQVVTEFLVNGVPLEEFQIVDLSTLAGRAAIDCQGPPRP